MAIVVGSSEERLVLAGWADWGSSETTVPRSHTGHCDGRGGASVFLFLCYSRSRILCLLRATPMRPRDVNSCQRLRTARSGVTSDKLRLIASRGESIARV